MIRFAAPIAFAISLAGAASAETAAPEPAEGAAAPAITVVQAAPALLRDRVFASGLIGPVERVFVQPKIEGQAIDELVAEVGDMVEAGQVLARLSQTALELQRSQFIASRASARAAIAQAEAQLVEAQASADEALRVQTRTDALRAQGSATAAAADQARAAAVSAAARVTVAEQGLAAAEAQLAVADAQLADVELNLERTLVAAPVGGQIVERNAQLGAIASANGEPMFVIVRDGLLELNADVAEQDVLKLIEGQSVRLTAVGLAGDLTGTVRLVEPTVDTATRLGRVRIALDDPSLVRSGMFAEGEILIAEREALAAPVTAVNAEADGSNTVLRVSPEGRVEKVTVETGIRDEGLVEILSGLQPGDMIVARAGAFVRPGDKINPVLVAAAN
jgi:HlyD family secretion protein